MQEYGIKTPPEYMVEARYHDADSVREATAALLDLDEPPTAIMFPDDFSYIGGQTEIYERGLSIPDDISVCGYDGINLSKILNPKLTTWYQNADRTQACGSDRGHECSRTDHGVGGVS